MLVSGRVRLTRVTGALLITAASLASAVSCKSSGVALSVDLRTDYVAGTELSHIVTEVIPDGESARSSDRSVSPGEAFVEGARVADFGDVPSGGVLVKVKVIGTDGNELVERLTRLSIKGDYALTVVVTRNCEGVTCPQPDGDQSASTCDRGKCVKAECSPQTPQYCAEPECSRDADCVADAACVSTRCVGGSCFFTPDNSKCDKSQTCDVAVGCTPPLTVPGCTPTSMKEVACNDGIDDDCDGKKDCDDPDCEGSACEDGDQCTEGEKCSALKCTGGTQKPCDDDNACTTDTCDSAKGCVFTNKTSGSCEDGNPCTENDTCVDGVCTAGTPKTCDDSNPCTTDICDPTTGCSNGFNVDPCNDGVFCNGADTCKDGLCQLHAGNPCGKVCDEAGDQCVGCVTNADCGPVTYSAWSTCGGFASTCDEGGTQSRTVTTPTCSSNTCTNVVTTQTQACSRVTAGVTCGTTTYGAWGSCGGYASACDTTGTRSRTKTTYACATGACKGTTVTETGSCSRTVANGTSCGTDKYCCGSSGCVSKGSNAHCSSCGIACGSGSSCVNAGTGKWTCTCSSNAQCQSWGFGSGATCYNAGAGMRCNCQCTTANCCAGGADCYKPSGQNYCSY